VPEFVTDQAPAKAETARTASPSMAAERSRLAVSRRAQALNRREFRQAADLFASLPGRFPRSGYADAYYWQAFALYRLGGEPRLRDALEALRIQREKFPSASTNGDAKALERRIQGELARAGDSQAAEEVAEAAAEAAEPGESSGSCDEDDTKLAALNALIT
jgi:hypothetical protein